MKKTVGQSCSQCGTCCRLFLINLTQEEWISGRYKSHVSKSQLKEFVLDDDFDSVQQYGGNILIQKEDGSCIYLKNNFCSIHKKRPQSCRNFFCASTLKKFKDMINMIKKKRKIQFIDLRMDAKKQYIITADILRIVSILAVVFVHTTTRTLEVSAYALQKIPFTLFLNQISRFAVPLFFMISGFVLELNYHLNESYGIYFKKRINRIFIPYVFWSTIYYFFVYSKNRNPNFLNSLLRGDASYQLYFIPALLIFYLIFPFIHKFLKIIGNIWVMIFLFLVQLILLFYDYNVHPLLLFYPLKIVLLNYFLFIFGVALSRHYDMFTNFLKKWKLFLFFGAIIFAYFIFHEGLNGYLSTHNYLKFYSQWRPSVLIYTIFLGGFLYWLFGKNILNISTVKILSRLSFFVFFIHVIILEVLWYLIGLKNFQLQFAQNLWWDPVYFIAVTLISFSIAHIAYIARKIPYLSKITG